MQVLVFVTQMVDLSFFNVYELNQGNMLMTESMTPEDEIASLIKRSRKAQEQIENYTQDQVNELITAMVYAVAKDDLAEEIAQFTIDETKLANYDGKKLKIHRDSVYRLLKEVNS